jgi:hypothetical protein
LRAERRLGGASRCVLVWAAPRGSRRRKHGMSTGEGAGPRAWGVRSRVVFTGRGLFRQSGEVVENARNELLAARILSVGGEELDQIAHLLGQFGPVRCRCCEKEFFELRLTRFPCRRRRISVAFWAAMPRCSSSSTGLSVMARSIDRAQQTSFADEIQLLCYPGREQGQWLSAIQLFS